jgi:hypothetical protein
MPTTAIPGNVGYPFPLGKILPGATFATASVPLTQNIQPVDVAGLPDNNWNGIFIQAHVLNVGPIYICSNAAGPDLVNYTNILGEVLPGGSFPRGKEWANNRDISKIFVGAGNATDFAIACLDGF